MPFTRGLLFSIQSFYIVVLLQLAPILAAAQSGSDQMNIQIEELIKKSIELRNKGQKDSARVFLGRAEHMASLYKLEFFKAKAINEDGVLYIYQSRYSEALSRLQEALTIYERIRDSTGIAECHNNIATVHFSQADYLLALENYQLSLIIRLQRNDLKEIGVSYNNIGIVHSRLDQLDSAFYYHTKSLEIWKQIGSKSGIGVTLVHLGGCEKLKGDLQEALGLYMESHRILLSTKDGIRASVSVEPEIGQLYFEMGDLANAKKWCESAYTRSHELASLHTILNSCFCLYQTYKKLGDFEKSIKHYEEYIALRDSSSGPEMIKEVTRIELNYAFEKIKEADSLRYVSERKVQEQMISQQRNALLSVFGIFLLAAALGIAIYKGKKRSDALLLNILPRETAKELKSKGIAQARFHPSATVMFTDFIGFTRISEKLSPQELVSELHQYFSVFDQIIEKYGLEKIKTIGDSYMVAGGLPLPKESHALDVVNAALEILRYISDLKLQCAKTNKTIFDIRIGVHSGSLVSGIVGTKKFQYDIWGDTVNTASRMESSGETDRLNISGATYELIKNDFVCHYRGKISVKGKGIIDMYFVEKPLI